MLQITGQTRIYGLLADPVEHMREPAVLTATYAQRGVDAAWLALHVTADDLSAAVAGLRHVRNFAGYAVGTPHKHVIARFCDELTPTARACGVVNVIRVAPDGRWIGEALDGMGMVKALAAHRPLDANTRVLLVGAGGVGRAIAVALALAGVGYLAIANRTSSRAEDLAAAVRQAAPACTVEAGRAFDPAGFDIAINATSLGFVTGDGPLPFDVASLPSTALVAEVVLHPVMTTLLVAAKERGLEIVLGHEMLTPQFEGGLNFLLPPIPGQ